MGMYRRNLNSKQRRNSRKPKVAFGFVANEEQLAQITETIVFNNDTKPLPEPLLLSGNDEAQAHIDRLLADAEQSKQ